eukprot:1194366-Prorocentrum_minimum.AAC.2
MRGTKVQNAVLPTLQTSRIPRSKLRVQRTGPWTNPSPARGTGVHWGLEGVHRGPGGDLSVKSRRPACCTVHEGPGGGAQGAHLERGVLHFVLRGGHLRVPLLVLVARLARDGERPQQGKRLALLGDVAGGGAHGVHKLPEHNLLLGVAVLQPDAEGGPVVVVEHSRVHAARAHRRLAREQTVRNAAERHPVHLAGGGQPVEQEGHRVEHLPVEQDQVVGRVDADLRVVGQRGGHPLVHLRRRPSRLSERQPNLRTGDSRNAAHEPTSYRRDRTVHYAASLRGVDGVGYTRRPDSVTQRDSTWCLVHYKLCGLAPQWRWSAQHHTTTSVCSSFDWFDTHDHQSIYLVLSRILHSRLTRTAVLRQTIATVVPNSTVYNAPSTEYTPARWLASTRTVRR